MSELSVFFSDEDFQIEGTSYVGIPIFVRRNSMKLEFLPSQFCIHLAVVRGQSRSFKTWKAYGYTLLSFIRFMEDKGYSWREPTEEYLGHFRTSLEAKSLTRATIAQALKKVCKFYEWGHSRGYIKVLPFTYDEVIAPNNGLLKHNAAYTVTNQPVVIPRVPRRRRHPRYFNCEEQERIYSFLSPRDRLIMDWALYTGAREFEICDLAIHDLPPARAYQSRNAYAIPVVGKFGVKADLYVPKWLLHRTHQYINLLGRASVARDARKRGKGTSDAIFLSRWGDALQPDSVYQNFKTALESAQLKGTFHALRHTYAISTLHKLMELPRHQETDGLNALMELKYLMRHRSITSTTVYLEAWRFYLTEAYSDLYELPERYLNA